MAVSLHIIVNAMYVATEETAYYLDRETGDICAVADPFECDETDQETEELIEKNPERFILLPGPEETDTGAMYLQFAELEQEPEVRERLRTAARHLYSSTMFPEEIAASGRRSQWEKFREEALMDLAREWAREQGIEISEEPESAQ